MPISMLRRLESEAAGLRAEGDALATLAEANGGYSDEDRTRRDEIIASVAQVESDIAAETKRQDWRREAPAEPVADEIAPSITDSGQDAAPAPFGSLGEQLQAVHSAAVNKHAAPDQRLIAINEHYSLQAAALGSGENVGADGGFLVQQDQMAPIIDRIFNAGVIASRCRTINVGPSANGVKIPLINETSRATGSRWGGVQTYWVDEGVAPTATRPKFRNTEFALKKLAAVSYATDELLADATAMDSILDQAFTEEMAFELDDTLWNGTGTGQPKGVLNLNATVSVAKETGQAASTLLAENIEKMYARLWARSMRSAVWYINQDVLPQLFQLKHEVGTGGTPVFVPPGGLSEAPFGTLLGRPIEVIEHAATLGTVGDIVLADMSQYALVRKGGIARAASIHVQFLTDQTAFRWILRVNGNTLWLSALTPYKGSNAISPFVSLDTRA